MELMNESLWCWCGSFEYVSAVLVHLSSPEGWANQPPTYSYKFGGLGPFPSSKDHHSFPKIFQWNRVDKSLVNCLGGGVVNLTVGFPQFGLVKSLFLREVDTLSQGLNASWCLRATAQALDIIADQTLVTASVVVNFVETYCIRNGKKRVSSCLFRGFVGDEIPNKVLCGLFHKP